MQKAFVGRDLGVDADPEGHVARQFGGTGDRIISCVRDFGASAMQLQNSRAKAGNTRVSFRIITTKTIATGRLCELPTRPQSWVIVETGTKEATSSAGNARKRPGGSQGPRTTSNAHDARDILRTCPRLPARAELQRVRRGRTTQRTNGGPPIPPTSFIWSWLPAG